MKKRIRAMLKSGDINSHLISYNQYSTKSSGKLLKKYQSLVGTILKTGQGCGLKLLIQKNF